MSIVVPAMGISVSNNVHTFRAQNFKETDGRFIGEIFVAWNGNANNSVDLLFSGNEGKVDITPYRVQSNQQTNGIVGVSIEMTDNEQTVVFSIRRVNGQVLTATVIVPALEETPVLCDVCGEYPCECPEPPPVCDVCGEDPCECDDAPVSQDIRITSAMVIGGGQRFRLFDEFDAVSANPPDSDNPYKPDVNTGNTGDTQNTQHNLNIWRTPASQWEQPGAVSAGVQFGHDTRIDEI